MKYRIVDDGTESRPYIAQYRLKWWPFWFDCFDHNKHYTRDEALKCVERHKNRIKIVEEVVP